MADNLVNSGSILDKNGQQFLPVTRDEKVSVRSRRVELPDGQIRYIPDRNETYDVSQQLINERIDFIDTPQDITAEKTFFEKVYIGQDKTHYIDKTGDVLFKDGILDNLHATGNITADGGVAAGGIADLLESGGGGFNDISFIGSGNAITDVSKNVNTLVFNREFTFMLASARGSANGVAPLDANSKIPAAYLYDYFFGQVLYGGGLGASALATLTSLAKSKLGIDNATITLTNNDTAITGYVANEGIYYIVTAAQTFAGISFEVGDWCISNGSAWTKVDNTDAVASVAGLTGTIGAESLAAALKPYIAYDTYASKITFAGTEYTCTNNNITITKANILSGINVADGAQVNVLEGIELNGTPLTPTTSKVVNVNACTSITVPTGLSAATLDANGLIAISLATGYAIPTTAKITEIETNISNHDACIGALAGQVLSLQSKNQFDELYSEYAHIRTLSSDLLIGYLKGNADTATKLATARTIWGQSFDGSGNISGAMSGVTKISISGNIADNDILNIENTAAGSSTYTRIKYIGSGRTWAAGVGNALESTLGVANKFYIHDVTANALRMSIDTSGNTVFGGQLTATKFIGTLNKKITFTGVGATAKVFDNSADIAITYTDVDAAPSTHPAVVATSSELGHIKTGYSNSGLANNYQPLLLSDGKAYVKTALGYDETTLSAVPEVDLYDYYGFTHDDSLTTSTCTAIGSARMRATLPVQSLIRRCILNDNGQVVYYLLSTDSTKKADGTNAVLDGTDGQYMVEIPAYYDKHEWVGLVHTYKQSLYPFTGAILHKKRYVSAVQATVQRSTSKLASVVNTTDDYRGADNSNAMYNGMPASSINLTDFRTYARNRNTNNTRWNCHTYDIQRDIYWMFVNEYLTLNSQGTTAMGEGVTDADDARWNTYNGRRPFVPCGVTNSLGNSSGKVAYTIANFGGSSYTTNVPSYRGIENPFGHIWQWTDGILVNVTSTVSTCYTTESPNLFSSTSFAAYTSIGNVARTNGSVSTIIGGSNGDIMPLTVSGSGTAYADYSYTDVATPSLRGVRFGGNAAYGSFAGFVCSASSIAPSSANAYIGSRLCFIPSAI